MIIAVYNYVHFQSTPIFNFLQDYAENTSNINSNKESV